MVLFLVRLHFLFSPERQYEQYEPGRETSSGNRRRQSQIREWVGHPDLAGAVRKLDSAKTSVDILDLDFMTVYGGCPTGCVGDRDAEHA